MLLLDDEKRRHKRRAAKMTATVEGWIDRMMTWRESTVLIDYSTLGAAFLLERRVKQGSLLQVSLPLPREMRNFDFGKEDYKVWGLVRRCVPVKSSEEGKYSVGVAFVGKDAPPEYFEDPGRRYELVASEIVEGFWTLNECCRPESQPVNHTKSRKEQRYEIPEEIVLELIDGNGSSIALETTVTINISQNGAAAYSELPAALGSTIRVTCPNTNIQLISVVRGIRTSQSGLSRINLEFIDRNFPINVI